MQYVRRIIQSLPLDQVVHLSTFPSSLNHPAFLSVKELGGERLKIHQIEDEHSFKERIRGRTGFLLQPAYWRLFQNHWKSLANNDRGELVEIPYLDYCSYAIGVFGSPFGTTQFQGVVMRPDFHWQMMGIKAPPSKLKWLKRFLFFRMLGAHSLRSLTTIDPSLKDWFDTYSPRMSGKLSYMEDPADLKGTGSRVDALEHFGIPYESKVILMFGAIDERKGLRLLVDAIAGDTFAGCYALIVGRQSPAAEEILRNAGHSLDRIICINRYVDAQEEWLAFQAADYVWLAYEGFYGPSGVFSQARQAGKVVIHNGIGLIGYYCNTSNDVQSVCIEGY